MTIDQRHIWAVEKMNIQRGDLILEIGCGSGVTATLIAEKLQEGKLTAIDRSLARIDRAEKRNQEFVNKGKAEFLLGTLLSLSLKGRLFDKIFAFNVGAFLNDAQKELSVIKSLLKPEGTLFVFYQPPYENSSEILSQIGREVNQSNFQIIESEAKPALPASIAYVVAKT